MKATLTTWYGRYIHELSREELIEALTQAVRLYHDSLQSNISSSQLLREMLQARG